MHKIKVDLPLENNLIINAPNYCSTISRIDEHLAHLKRNHVWAPNSNELDVYGQCWILTWINFSDSELAVKRKGKIILLNGPLAIFSPPFSMIDWQFKGGPMFFEGLISNYRLPPGLPNEPTLLKRNNDSVIPSSLEEIIQFVKQAVPLESLAKEEQLSAVAIKTKNYIDNNYEREFSISEMAIELKYSHAVMDRLFKKNYGITPLEYRNRLRVLDSAHQMILESKTVSQACNKVGFSGTDNFNKQFKKIMKVPPSRYATLRPKMNISSGF